MLSEKMQSIQNLIDELVSGYIQTKYDEKYLKEKIQKILEFIVPEIARIIKNKEEKEPIKLWEIIKEDSEIEDLLRKIIEKVDRPIVIYVASKFENNQYFGTRIIDEALKWK